MFLGDSRCAFLLKFDLIGQVLELEMTKFQLNFIDIRKLVIYQKNSTIKIFFSQLYSLKNFNYGENWIRWTYKWRDQLSVDIGLIVPLM